MPIDIEFEMTDFNRALREYARFRKKDNRYIVARASLNLVIKAASVTTKAQRSAIKSLADRPWWPKYVAKRLTTTGVRIRQKVGQNYEKVLHKYGKKKPTYPTKHYTVDIARKASRAIINARIRRIGYVKGGWLQMHKELSKLKTILKLRALARTVGAFTGANKKIKKLPGRVVLPQAELNPVTELYTTKKVKPIMLRALKIALPRAAADMRQYIKDQMLKRAKQFAPLSR